MSIVPDVNNKLKRSSIKARINHYN